MRSITILIVNVIKWLKIKWEVNRYYFFRRALLGY